MRKQLFLLFLLVFSVFCFSQKSEIIFTSKNTHNYVIGKSFYIEDAIDTSKILFMGTIKIVSSNQDVFISKAHNLLEYKTKELNANAYKLKSFTSVDTTLHLIFDVYFASEKQIELIKTNRIKNKYVYFNNIKDTLLRTIFFNNQSASFSKLKHLQVTNVCNKKICFSLDTINNASKCKQMKQDENAYFYSIKIKENTGIYIVYPGAIPILIAASIATTASGLAFKYIKPNQEKFTNISYNLGRLLMEIYPLDKVVKLD